MPQAPRTCETVGPSLRSLSDSTASSGVMLGGKYDIKKKIELYKGSVSTVFKCLLASGNPVVVKTYHKAKMAEKHFHKLEREVAAMRALCRDIGKKGVVQLLDTFEDTHGIYLVMECCEGGDLFKRLMLQGGRLAESWVCLEVIVPLLRVLERMHELHIMHRDIKPENIFITADGEVKLGDFGLAIDWTKELPFSRSGTLDYMAPEVLMNPATHTQESTAITVPQLLSKNIRPYTAAVDVWAVGCLAYELVCGRPPFEVEDEKQTASLIIYSNNIHFDSAATPSWADFVTQALIKDPRQRPDASTLLGHPWIRSHLERAPVPTVAPAVSLRGATAAAGAAAEPGAGSRSSNSSIMQHQQRQVASSTVSGSACGSAATTTTESGSVFSVANASSRSTHTGSSTAPQQQQRNGTPSATAHSFRTAAAMLANRASQQAGCMSPPPAVGTSAAASPAMGSVQAGTMYGGAPASAPPQQRQQPTSPVTPSFRPANLGSSGALRSLLDAFKSASVNSNGEGSGGAGGAERSQRAALGGRPPSAGSVPSASLGSGSSNPTSSLLRTSFQFQIPSAEREAQNSGAASKLLRTSFQVQLPSERTEVSLGGMSTAAVVGGRTPSLTSRDSSVHEALPRGGAGSALAPLQEPQPHGTVPPMQLRPVPPASGCPAPAGATNGGFSSPPRMGRGNAATIGGLIYGPGSGSSSSSQGGVMLPGFLRSVTSLSAAGGCNSSAAPQPGVPAAEAAASATTGAASAAGLLGKPPRPQSESPGKVFAMASAAVAAQPPCSPTSPLRRALPPSPPRASQQPSASPPRPQHTASPPRLQPSLSGPGVEWTPGGSAAAAPPSSATLHDLTRNWGAVVSITVNKYSNPPPLANHGGGRGSGSGSAFASPTRSPAGAGKMLDPYGLPAPTPVASGLPPAEYCSPRPSGVLERVKYHLRGGSGVAVAGGSQNGQQQVQQAGMYAGSTHALGMASPTTAVVAL